MKYKSEKNYRRSIRLKNYDYTNPGAYFITICTYHRECIFGEIVDEEILLNDVGFIVNEEWKRSVEIRKEIKLDEFVVMPNHIHGIVHILKSGVGATSRSPLPRGSKPRSLGSFIGGYKSAVTKRVNEMCGTPGKKVAPTTEIAKISTGDTLQAVLILRNFYFEPSRIVTEAGKPLKLTLKKRSGFLGIIPHDFNLIAPDANLNVDNQKVTGGNGVTITITPTKVGEYRFYCSKGGHAKKGMQGLLIVKEHL